jgi:hypothetical protein
MFQKTYIKQNRKRKGEFHLKQKVSLKWLANSDNSLAVKFRNGISDGLYKCALCCMFFEDDYEDSEGNVFKCNFNEISDKEIEHFQQMADGLGMDIKIVSLDNSKDTTKEVVQFT